MADHKLRDLVSALSQAADAEQGSAALHTAATCSRKFPLSPATSSNALS